MQDHLDEYWRRCTGFKTTLITKESKYRAYIPYETKADVCLAATLAHHLHGLTRVKYLSVSEIIIVVAPEFAQTHTHTHTDT